MTTHKITAELTVSFPSTDPEETETAHPTVEITYNFVAGCPARIRYDENDHPADPDEVDFVSAKMIDGDGIGLDDDQLHSRAEDWLNDEGYEKACDLAKYGERAR